MTVTTIAPVIDERTAEAVLNKLGYVLQDLGLEYGDVVIADNDISHQLYYSSEYSSINLIGYVHIENGIYYTDNNNNHRSPEQAALDLIPQSLIDWALDKIKIDRLNGVLMPDYI
jgi:hypothetical protein